MNQLIFIFLIIFGAIQSHADGSLISKAMSVFSGKASQAEFYGINVTMNDSDFFNVVKKSDCKDITLKIDKADQFAGMTKWVCKPKHKTIESIEVVFEDKKLYRVDFIFSGKFPDLEESHKAIMAKFDGKLQPLSQFGNFGEHDTVIGSCAAWSGGINNCTSRRWMEEHSFVILYSHQGEHALGIRLANRDDSLIVKVQAAYKKYDDQQKQINRKTASDLGF